jgi:hypothetical protein
MRKIIHLKDLLPVKVLFESDFHELATFILRGFDAQKKLTGIRSRPTVHGVASTYARLFIEMDSQKIDAQLRRMGYDLGATVEWDDGPTESSLSSSRGG